MASVHGGDDYRAVVVQDGSGPVRVVQWLIASQADPGAAQLQSLAYGFSLNPEKFGTPVTARVIKAMRPGPLYATLDNDQYLSLSGINADGTVGTPQTNDDPSGTPYVPGDNYGITL